MTKTKIEYIGNLRCKAMRQPSGIALETDAPVDFGGKGENFSPTDLIGVALATCIATTLGIYAQRKGIDLSQMHLDVEKGMTNTPSRRLGKLTVNLWIPHEFTLEEKKTLEHVAHTCPVHKSLHPDVDVDIKIHWGRNS